VRACFLTKCKLEMRPVAVILNDKELVRLLTHLGLPSELPKFKPVPQAALYEHACGRIWKNYAAVFGQGEITAAAPAGTVITDPLNPSGHNA